jgi:L-ascorbate metabolism protein UlaG (beta-lactamase superfamily)
LSSGRIDITWLGHASVLIQIDGLRVLTDPVLGRAGFLRRVGPPLPPIGRVDAVLVSHLHADHADLRSLRAVADDVPVVGPTGVTSWLRSRGFTRLVSLDAGAATELAGTRVEATPARHDGRRWPWGPPAEAVGFLVGDDPGVYFAGDTDIFPRMSELQGRAELALVPIWGWGPTLGPGHLNPGRAAAALAAIRPRFAIPIHWGTLAPLWTSPGRAARPHPERAFAHAARELAPTVEVRVLAPGESVSLL